MYGSITPVFLSGTSTEPIPCGSIAFTCFWKKQGFAEPSGQRTSESGRPAMCGSICAATAQ